MTFRKVLFGLAASLEEGLRGSLVNLGCSGNSPAFQVPAPSKNEFLWDLEEQGVDSEQSTSTTLYKVMENSNWFKKTLD